MNERRFTTHHLVLMAFLVAAQIVLSRFFSLQLWNLKLGFAFVPIALAGMLLGPVPAALVAVAADLIGATAFPTAAFFPGFTFTACFWGLTYGIFLHKNQSMKNIVAAVLVYEIIGSLGMNTLWVSILYGAPYLSLVPPRIVQSVGMGILEIVTLRLIAAYLPSFKKAVLHA